MYNKDIQLSNFKDALVTTKEETQRQKICTLWYHFTLFHKIVKLSGVFEIKSLSKYNLLSLTFLCINRQTQDHQAPVSAGGNYLEKAAMLQV